MTTALRLVPAPASDLLPARAKRLRALIRPETLDVLHWDERSRILRPSPDHPFLGMHICARSGCWAAARNTDLGLCSACRGSWKRSGKTPEDFLATEPKQISNISGGCAVPKCRRPGRRPARRCACGTASCSQGWGARRWRSSSPTPAFARCLASACARSTPATGTRRTVRTCSAPALGEVAGGTSPRR
ncbi:hypothetical protein NKH77_48705 [Streptomyces sp. M19]